MKKNYFILLYLILIFAQSCLYKEKIYAEKIVYIQAPGDSKVVILSGKSDLIKNSNSDNYIYKVKFQKVEGGSTSLFSIKIKESNGYTSKRLHIIKDHKISDYSYEEILKKNFIILNTIKVYKLQ